LNACQNLTKMETTMEVLLDLLVKKEQEIEVLLEEINYLNSVIESFKNRYKRRKLIGFKLKGATK
jgi:hypothetical protein